MSPHQHQHLDRRRLVAASQYDDQAEYPEGQQTILISTRRANHHRVQPPATMQVNHQSSIRAVRDTEYPPACGTARDGSARRFRYWARASDPTRCTPGEPPSPALRDQMSSTSDVAYRVRGPT